MKLTANPSRRLLRYFTLSVLGLAANQIAAQEHYRFNCEDYISCDDARAPQANFSYDETANTLTIQGSTTNDGGKHNVAFAMKKENDDKYHIYNTQDWFLVEATGIASTDHAIWWFNGFNTYGQTATYCVPTADGTTLVLWNIRDMDGVSTGLNYNLSRLSLSSRSHDFSLCMGLTSGTADGTATVSHIGYYAKSEAAATYPALMETFGYTDESLTAELKDVLSQTIQNARRNAGSRLVSDAKKDMQEAINTAQGVCDTAGSTDHATVLKALDDLRQATEDFYAHTAAATEANDITSSYIQNPSFEEDGQVISKRAPAGWTVDCAGNTWCGVNNNTSDPEATDGNYIFGIWHGTTDAPSTIQQEISLPAGTYRLTVDMMASDRTSQGSAQRLGNQRLFANEAVAYLRDQVLTAGGGDTYQLQTLTLDFTVTADNSPVKIGVATSDAPAETWYKIDNFRLYALEAPTLALDETGTYPSGLEGMADVRLSRTLKAGQWNTFCVPFGMTAEQLAANAISKVVELSVYPASTNESINLTSTEETEVKAGVPYLVQVSEDVTEISVDGAYVTAAAPAAQALGQAGDYTVAMTGNYSATTVPQGAYFINGDKFYIADRADAVSLKGFRAYITLEDGTGTVVESNIRSIGFSAEGDGTTAIDGIEGEAAGQPVDVYTLSGMKVKGGVEASEALDGLRHGIYVVNGKKIIK